MSNLAMSGPSSILLAEKDPLITSLLAQRISLEGFSITLGYRLSGLHALLKAGHRFGAIVVDEDGFEGDWRRAREIQLAFSPETLFILLTSEPTEALRRSGMIVVCKPFDVVAVGEMIHRLACGEGSWSSLRALETEGIAPAVA